MEQCVRSPSRLRGTVVVPGDKSISHRAAILNAIALGPARVENFLVGEDTRATLDCLQALGVSWSLEETGSFGATLSIHGLGRVGLRESEDVLDARNSGTTMRLLAGVLGAHPFFSVLTGDTSLRSRPMGRVGEPLREMGAQVWGRREWQAEGRRHRRDPTPGPPSRAAVQRHGPWAASAASCRP